MVNFRNEGPGECQVTCPVSHDMVGIPNLWWPGLGKVINLRYQTPEHPLTLLPTGSTGAPRFSLGPDTAPVGPVSAQQEGQTQGHLPACLLILG